MEELIKEIIKFKNDRNWDQFHTTKDLLLGLSIEVSELQELVLWKTENDIKEGLRKARFKENISNEVADIFIFLAYLAEKFDIKIEKAVEHKLKVHKRHYPINKSKNKNIKYPNLKK